MKYLTVSADCTKESRDLLSVEWDEGELGEPTGEAVLKALREGRADYDVVDVPVRFDVVSIVLVAPDRAMIRHHINAYSS